MNSNLLIYTKFYGKLLHWLPTFRASPRSPYGGYNWGKFPALGRARQNSLRSLEKLRGQQRHSAARIWRLEKWREVKLEFNRKSFKAAEIRLHRIKRAEKLTSKGLDSKLQTRSLRNQNSQQIIPLIFLKATIEQLFEFLQCLQAPKRCSWCPQALPNYRAYLSQRGKRFSKLESYKGRDGAASPRTPYQGTKKRKRRG